VLLIYDIRVFGMNTGTNRRYCTSRRRPQILEWFIYNMKQIYCRALS